MSCPNLRRFWISQIDWEGRNYLENTFQQGPISELVIDKHSEDMEPALELFRGTSVNKGDGGPASIQNNAPHQAVPLRLPHTFVIRAVFENEEVPKMLQGLSDCIRLEKLYLGGLTLWSLEVHNGLRVIYYHEFSSKLDY
jgi:hypothetical protein